jgi:broad specificity phosphatase PhoE
MSHKRLLLVRHAHRNTDEPSRDNGLSEKGHEQVERLVRYFQEQLKDEKIQFFTSPKKRCRETLGPIAKTLKGDIEVDDRITETGPIENQSELRSRLESFFDEWLYEGTDVTVVCSHGDIIPVVVERLTGARIGIKKAGVVEIEAIGRDCFLMGLLQKVPNE